MNENGGTRGQKEGRWQERQHEIYNVLHGDSEREKPRDREAGEIKNGCLFIHNFLFIQITSQPSGRPWSPCYVSRRGREGVGIKDRDGRGRENRRWGQVKEGGDGQRKEEEKQGDDDDDGNWWCHNGSRTAGEELVHRAQATSKSRWLHSLVFHLATAHADAWRFHPGHAEQNDRTAWQKQAVNTYEYMCLLHSSAFDDIPESILRRVLEILSTHQCHILTLLTASGCMHKYKQSWP